MDGSLCSSTLGTSLNDFNPMQLIMQPYDGLHGLQQITEEDSMCIPSGGRITEQYDMIDGIICAEKQYNVNQRRNAMVTDYKRVQRR